MQIKLLAIFALSLCVGFLASCTPHVPDCEAYCNNSGPYSCTTNPDTNPTICDGTNGGCG